MKKIFSLSLISFMAFVFSQSIQACVAELVLNSFANSLNKLAFGKNKTRGFEDRRWLRSVAGYFSRQDSRSNGYEIAIAFFNVRDQLEEGLSLDQKGEFGQVLAIVFGRDTYKKTNLYSVVNEPTPGNFKLVSGSNLGLDVFSELERLSDFLENKKPDFDCLVSKREAMAQELDLKELFSKKLIVVRDYPAYKDFFDGHWSREESKKVELNKESLAKQCVAMTSMEECFKAKAEQAFSMGLVRIHEMEAKLEKLKKSSARMDVIGRCSQLVFWGNSVFSNGVLGGLDIEIKNKNKVNYLQDFFENVKQGAAKKVGEKTVENACWVARWGVESGARWLFKACLGV